MMRPCKIMSRNPETGIGVNEFKQLAVGRFNTKHHALHCLASRRIRTLAPNAEQIRAASDAAFNSWAVSCLCYSQSHSPRRM